MKVVILNELLSAVAILLAAHVFAGQKDMLSEIITYV